MSGEVAHQEAPAAKEAARDLDPTKADEPAGAGVALLSGGARILSPSHLAGLQGLVGNASVARLLQPSVVPVVARQEAPDKRAAQWSHGWMAGSLKELAALPPAELTKVEAHAKDPDVEAKRFEIMLAAVRLSKAGGAKDWQLRDLYRQMQGASIPQDQQQEVATFVGAFGLFTPKAINEYVKDVGDIFANWAELGSAEARAEAFGYLTNRQLGYQRVPPVKIVVAGIASGGEFDKDTWTITISTRLGALNLTPEQQSDLIRRAAANFLHEARHAEQIFTVARARAGAGSSPETLAKELKIPTDIASKAHGLKVLPGSPESIAAKAWYESEFGEGKAHRDQVLGDLDQRHDEYAALPEEADAHALGVSLADRIRGGVPAPAGAGGGDGGAPPGGVQRQVVVQRCGAAHPDCDCGPDAESDTQPRVQTQRAPVGTPVVQRQSEVPDSYRVRHNLSRLSFNTDQAEVKKTLELFVDERDDSKALELFDNDAEFVGPLPIFAPPGAACDLDPKVCAPYRQEVVRLVRQEVRSLKFRMGEFRTDFERRGHDTLNLLLTDSEGKINAEKERYGLQKKEGTFSWLFGADYSLNNPEDLTKAAKALLEKYLAMSTASAGLKKCTDLGGTLPPGGTDAMCTPEDKARAEAELLAQERDYSIARKQHEGAHPILITYDLDPRKENTHGVLATLAADSGDAKAELLYKQIEEKLANIRTTREYAIEHRDVIWKLPTVIGVTQKLPDIAGYEKLKWAGLQNIAIDDAKSATVVRDLILGAALAAVAIGLGLIATPLASAGMTAAAGAATATEAGIGIAMTLNAIHQFEFEQAATNTDLDTKAKSISQEEPSLLWLAFDIVMTVAQLKQAAETFHGFVKLSRAAQAAKAAKTEGAGKLLDQLQEEGNTFKKGAGDQLRREAEQLVTSVGQDAGQIAAGLENVTKSGLAGYTHEIAMGEGKFWRRTAEGRWCFFASPPRCPLGVMDYMLAPWLSGLTPETTAALMNYKRVLKLAKADPRVGVLLEKYGVDGVRAMEHAPFHGWDGLDMLQRFDKLNGKVKGAEQLLRDLAAGESTTRGAIGEISYIEMLLEDGYQIERVADWINGQKAADIVLKDKTIIDVKYYDWSNWRWRVPAEAEKSAQSMVTQVALRKKQYPGSDIVYVFAGAKGDVPPEVAKALNKAGVKVRGTFRE